MSQNLEIKCAYDKIVNINELKPNPRNPNKHPKNQIELLAKIIKYQGWRSPIVVSNRSGLIVKGHGRLDAAKIIQAVECPVDYQDYQSEADENADMIADNKIAELADSNLDDIRNLALEFPKDFDLDLIGIENFELQLGEAEEVGKEWAGMPEFNNEDKTSFRDLIVHFKTQTDFEDFFKLINQSFTESTKMIWYPKIEIERLMDKRY